MENKQLFAWRRQMGLTTTAAADALGITPNAYRDMESGKSKIGRRTWLACAALHIGETKINQPWMKKTDE